MGGITKRVDVLCGSHIPVLYTLMGVISEPVLELGIGYSSTPILHWLCKIKNLMLCSIESDEEWLKKFDPFEDKHHYLFHADLSKDVGQTLSEVLNIPGEVKMEWGLVLVDHRPARKRRSSALYFKDSARFILLHDSELANDPAYKYTPIYKHFKYKFEYTKTMPHSMILSNFEDPSVYFSKADGIIHLDSK